MMSVCVSLSFPRFLPFAFAEIDSEREADGRGEERLVIFCVIIVVALLAEMRGERDPRRISASTEMSNQAEARLRELLWYHTT